MDDSAVSRIRINFDSVNERITRAARASGRKPEEIRLVVVTKAQPVEVIQAAIEAGARVLGENYPEETLPKIEAIGKPDGLEWHMIGHLQSRKANIVAQYFSWLESLDSVKLAERLNRLIEEQPVARVLPVLLEFNVGGEESKSGWNAQDEARWDALLVDVEQILALPSLSVLGLMTMPPISDQPEESRPYFVKLRRLRDFLARHFPQSDFSQLSMGTSGDFEVAVQEGATLVRVGTAILGPRPRKPE